MRVSSSGVALCMMRGRVEEHVESRGEKEIEGFKERDFTGKCEIFLGKCDAGLVGRVN